MKKLAFGSRWFTWWPRGSALVCLASLASSAAHQDPVARDDARRGRPAGDRALGRAPGERRSRRQGRGRDAAWFTVGVDNAAAKNEISAAAELAERLAGMPANAPGRAKLQADYQARSAPAKIVLGDAARPWTGAVQLLLAGTAGTRR